MPDGPFVLGKHAMRQVVRAVRHFERTRPTQRKRPQRPQYYYPVYIAKTKAGGIDARSSDTPGSATVDVYEIDDSGDLADTGEDITAYNIASNPVDASTYIQVKMDMYGKYIVDFEDC